MHQRSVRTQAAVSEQLGKRIVPVSMHARQGRNISETFRNGSNASEAMPGCLRPEGVTPPLVPNRELPPYPSAKSTPLFGRVRLPRFATFIERFVP